ncbi:MAG: hypothetical protein UV98_C0014G0002 [Parcubacteria group bacterium GW2011_GWB1_43_6]|nr:MAG: hypothetical protein UV98_C0014G0002 [Parcubacteria group bacterium GW2011_GWB1_43_6]
MRVFGFSGPKHLYDFKLWDFNPTYNFQYWKLYVGQDPAKIYYLPTIDS